MDCMNCKGTGRAYLIDVPELADCRHCSGTGAQPQNSDFELTDIEVTPDGGKHTKLNTRCDLIPPDAMIQVAEVLHRGSHYGEDNWRLIKRKAHLNHALTHIFEFQRGDRSETHLANAACRLLFALETDDGPKDDGGPVRLRIASGSERTARAA